MCEPRKSARARCSWRAGLTSAALVLLSFPGCSVAEDSDAHALAQKFAGEAPAASSPATTVAPAAVPDSLEARRRAAEAKQAEAQKRAAEARRREAEARRKADVAVRAAQQLRIDEADMLARARAEADERAAADRVRIAEQDRLAAVEAAAAAQRETEQIEKSRAAADQEAEAERLVAAAKAADAARRVMEADREAETSRLAERLRQARERREVSGREADAPPAMAAAETPAAPKEAPSELAFRQPPAPTPTLTGTGETRVSVLILMQAGQRGIRRFDKTADPVLCIAADCYVSNGPERDAKRIERRRALGTLNTLGARAGACNDQLGCVFRNVELGALRASLQPVDLRIMRHDRREAREAGADPSCEVVAGRLHCAAAVTAGDYRAWIVPESLARKVGPALLEGAVRDGLPDSRRAAVR